MIFYKDFPKNLKKNNISELRQVNYDLKNLYEDLRQVLQFASSVHKDQFRSGGRTLYNSSN